jgi:uncharacterized protein (UPF0332 family)
MNFEKLLEENKIEKILAKEFDISLAERDIEAAQHNFESKDYEWTLSIGYNAVLQACRSLMFSLGYRPKGKNQHVSVFEFMRIIDFDNDLIDYFDKIRKRRHIAVYDEVDCVSENDAKDIIEKSKEFVHKIRTYVHKIRTDKK